MIMHTVNIIRTKTYAGALEKIKKSWLAVLTNANRNTCISIHKKKNTISNYL